MRWRIRTNDEEFKEKYKKYEEDFESKFPINDLPPLPADFFKATHVPKDTSGLVTVDNSGLYTRLYQQGGWKAIGEYKGVDIDGPDYQLPKQRKNIEQRNDT